MPKKTLKIGLTVLVLSLAFAGLLWSTLSEGTEYYMHVDEVLADPDAWQDKRLQVHGYAANVTRARNSLDYRFELQYNGAVIQAEYSGVVPDTFKNEAEVVAKGRLANGRLLVDANGIMAKCPSKYEARPGGGLGAGAGAPAAGTPAAKY